MCGKEKEEPGIHCLRMYYFFKDLLELVNYTGHSRIFLSLLIGGANYELSHQFKLRCSFWPWSFSVGLAFAVLVLLRIVFESIRDSGDLAESRLLNNQTRQLTRLQVN